MLADTVLELTYQLRDAIQTGDLDQAQALAQVRMEYLEALSKDSSTASIAEKLFEADTALQQTALMERERLRSALLIGPVSPKSGSYQPTAQFLDKAA